MKISDSLLKTFYERNPFSDNAARGPWASSSFPDIPGINSQAFEGIKLLIRQKASDPRRPLAGLILGEAGFGKTHLIRRILEYCRNLSTPILFVFVKPLFDPERPIHHLLQEIVLSLSKENQGERFFSQFERLVAEMMRDFARHRVHSKDNTPENQKFLEKFEEDVFHLFNQNALKSSAEVYNFEETVFENLFWEKIRIRRNGSPREKVDAEAKQIIEEKAIKHIHSRVPDAGKDFLNVIFQYKTEDKRGLVRDWLKGGELDEEDNQLINVKSRAGKSKASLEEEARKMLISFGILFQRYHLPMVVCFDQLDNLVREDFIAGFASMIHLLVNDVSNILPLAFIRQDSWYERFEKYPDPAFLDRLRSNQFELSGCTREQAKQILSVRIETVFDGEPENAQKVKNWVFEQLEEKFKKSKTFSPREIILLANQVVWNSTSATTSDEPATETLAEAYQKASDDVASDFESWDIDSDYLSQALKFLLHARKGRGIVSFERCDAKYAGWSGRMIDEEKVERPFAFFINTSKNERAVWAVLRRVLEFLKNNPNSICAYIADQRCEFKTMERWKETNERRQEFEKLGGNFLILNQSTVVKWYGLVNLFLKIGNNDVILQSHGSRFATEENFYEFLAEGFEKFEEAGRFDELFKKKITSLATLSTSSMSTPTELIETICGILSKASVPIVTLEVLLNQLQKKDIHIKREVCLEHIGKNTETLSLIASRDSYMVKLTPRF